MKSITQLAVDNKWQEQEDNAKGDNRYRIELKISQLTKKEAIDLRAKIYDLLHEELLDYQLFVAYDLLEISILNENTGRYTQSLEDKY